MSCMSHNLHQDYSNQYSLLTEYYNRFRESTSRKTIIKAAIDVMGQAQVTSLSCRTLAALHFNVQLDSVDYALRFSFDDAGVYYKDQMAKIAGFFNTVSYYCEDQHLHF